MHNAKEKYLDFLSETVINEDGSQRPRVRYPMKWKNVKSTSKSGDFIDLTTFEGDIWLWSDPHFEHKRVIEFCNRPFPSIDDMKMAMVNNYNNTISEGDVCIWGGDIVFGSTTYANEETLPLFKKGYNIQVMGNHDFNKKKIRPLEFDERHLLINIVIDDVEIIITHYPCKYNNRDLLNIHGHIHHKKSEEPYQFNISVDAIGFKPINMTKILKQWKINN